MSGRSSACDPSVEPARAGFVFGRRKGKKLRARQSGLMASALPALALDLAQKPLDPTRLFGRAMAQVHLEIGFGGGEHLANAADRARDIGFIGCEPFANGVAKLLGRVEALGLDNLRVHAGDAIDLLFALPDASINRLFLLFPDPWPKRRQRKRRFVNETSLAEMARVLKPGAEFRFATDIDDYAAWTLARIARRSDFAWLAEGPRDWLSPWADWPGTRYEAKALAERRRPVYLTFSRSARAP